MFIIGGFVMDWNYLFVFVVIFGTIFGVVLYQLMEYKNK